MTTQSTIALTGRGIYIRPDGRVVLPGLRLTVSAIRALEGLHGAKHDGKTNEWVVDTRKSIFSLPILGHICKVQPDLCDELDQPTLDRLELARTRYADNVDAASELEPDDLVVETLKAVLPPRMVELFRPYQYAAVDYVLRRARKRAFLADDPGGGKTAMSLACAHAASAARPAVVICKSTLKHNWANEIRAWLPDGQNIAILEGTTNVGIPEDANWVIVNYEIVHQRLPDILEATPTALVIDESQMVKSPADKDGCNGKTNTFEEVMEWVSMTPAEQRENKDKKPKFVGAWRSWAARAISRSDDMEMVLMLSATPAPNGRHYEWWPQIDVLGRGKDFGGRKAFVDRYCRYCETCVEQRLRVCTHRTWPTRFRRENNEGAINADELARRLRASMMVRRSQRQMFPHLPPINHMQITLPMSTRGTHPLTGDTVNWRTEYQRAEEEFVEWLKEHSAGKARAEGESVGKAIARAVAVGASEHEKLAQMAYMRKIAALSKLDALLEWIVDYVGQDEDGQHRKAVVFAWHQDVQKAIIDGFNAWVRGDKRLPNASTSPSHIRERLEAQYGKGGWVGVPRILAATEMTGQEIEADKARFQTVDAEPIIVCSIGAAAEGHTLSQADAVLMAESPTAAGVARQCAGRAYGRADNPTGIQMVDFAAVDPKGAFQTIEEKLLDRLELRKVLMANTLDQGRSLEWERTDDGPTEQDVMGGLFDDYLKR